MELNIEDTSCPSNKTSNWRYAIIIVEPGIIGFVLFLDFHFHNNKELTKRIKTMSLHIRTQI